MKTRFGWGLASAILASGIGPAFAADMPLKAKALPPPVLAYNWTGCYVGGNVGWNGSDNHDFLRPSGAYLTPAGALAPPNVNGTGALPGDLLLVTHNYNTFDSGFTGGGQVGCNFQRNQWVFGIEGDINGSSVRNNISAAFAAVPSVSPGFTI